jgi:CheY-like chemotaxis protein
MAQPPSNGRESLSPEPAAILLVDDEEAVRQVGTTMLEHMGWQVVPARDGREALEVFQANPGQFALVLLDLTMPDIDGEEVYRRLKQVRPEVPVLMSSGYTAQEIGEPVADGGVDGFLQKPYTFAELATQVKALIQRD